MKQLFTICSFAIVGIALAAYCNTQPTAGNEPKANCNQLQPGQKGFIQLAESKEPGEKLVIYGRVVDHKTHRPVPGVSMLLYHADTKGIYGNAGQSEERARIRGTVGTASTGCFKIKTILPGDYPGQNNSRHLHYEINAKGYKKVTSTLFFKGFTPAGFNPQNNFIVLDIKKDSTGAWVGTANFEMQEGN